MTYSILAWDERTGQIGGGVQSHFFQAGNIALWAQPGIGAVATQAFADPSYGPNGLSMMGDRHPPEIALSSLLDKDSASSTRQVAFINANGNHAVHTGSDCFGHAEHSSLPGVIAQGNMLTSAGTTDAMVAAFATAQGDLGSRLLAGLEAAQAHGGDARGQQSAALRVVSSRPNSIPGDGVLLDLHVDDSVYPLVELRRLLDLHRTYAHLGVIFEPGIVSGTQTEDATVIDSALAAIDRTLTELPNNPEALMWRAIILARSGRPGARRARDVAVQANPTLDTFFHNIEREGHLSPHQR